MQVHFYSLECVLLFTLALEGASGLRRPEYMSRARVAPEFFLDADDNSPTTTNRPAKAPESNGGGRMTSEKCCKVGERVAKEGMYCSYDIHVAARQPNFVYRHKLKLFNQDSSKSQIREFKSLTLRITKCFQHKDMFEKCCNYRTSFLVSMRRCRELKGTDRKHCRLKTRKTFGF